MCALTRRPFTATPLKLRKPVPSDIEVAQESDIKPISQITEELGLLPMEKNRELFKKFTEAVEIGDEVQIKSILPLLFQQIKESNQQLEEHLEILKNGNEE